jgi:hypothetical protein
MKLLIILLQTSKITIHALKQTPTHWIEAEGPMRRRGEWRTRVRFQLGGSKTSLMGLCFVKDTIHGYYFVRFFFSNRAFNGKCYQASRKRALVSHFCPMHEEPGTTEIDLDIILTLSVWLTRRIIQTYNSYTRFSASPIAFARTN